MMASLLLNDKAANNTQVQSIIDWQQVTLSANIAFSAGYLVYANCLYESAVVKAKHLFDKLVCSRDSVAAVLVSFHNLADFHMHNNNRHDALNCLREAVFCLSNKLKKNKLTLHSEAALIWGLGRANRQLWLVEKNHKVLSDEILEIH
jgi:hypothetical protein